MDFVQRPSFVTTTFWKWLCFLRQMTAQAEEFQLCWDSRYSWSETQDLPRSTIKQDQSYSVTCWRNRTNFQKL